MILSARSHRWWLGLVVLGWLMWPGGWVFAQAAGTPGGPCLPDNTCQAGAQCYVSPNGNICLLPAANPGNNNNGGGGAILQQCPPQHRYLACKPDGSDCQLRCIYPKGFGCNTTSPTPSSLWAILGLLFCARLRRWRKALT